MTATEITSQDSGGNVADNPQLDVVMPANQAELNRMIADTKRVLKNYSKNELVRIVISQLIETHQLRQHLESLSKPVQEIKSENTTT